jgi:hypothetical protein
MQIKFDLKDIYALADDLKVAVDQVPFAANRQRMRYSKHCSQKRKWFASSGSYCHPPAAAGACARALYF